MNLTEAKEASVVEVSKVYAEGELRRRFFDLGIIEGTKIEVLYKSPFGDPVAYLIRGAVIAIRKEDGERIKVVN
ncbi:FeoA family protein [uncultured Clostridium sp.]|uniref:FeoA family protein n=1 Tax=uncultured Clostridium sp. TaxID=59620 RepID=UPI0025E543BC|nr:FeoA family protein [uncultured Clostridium sp.]